MAREEPRWVVPFIRALERTGEVRAAAVDAGIDHTTAYVRRKTHADFALRAHAAAKARAEEEEIAAIRTGGFHLAPSPSLSLGGRGAEGDEFVINGGQVKRVGHDRWSKRKEKIFFEELAATNNIQRSAAAAGVSANAVHSRRLKHPVFRAKWDAVVQSAKASIDLYLVEETKKTFDPDELDTADVRPKVTIAEAIKIAQSGGGTAKTQREPPMTSWQEEADSMSPDEIEAVRERIIRKLRRLKEREMPRKLAAGWSYDESYDLMIPPGWVKGPHYKPRDPELPVDFYWR